MDSTELCRLCATEKDTFVDGFVRIYSDEGQKFGLEKKIIRCLQIELCSEDDLPKSVCLECCSKLHQCADFVESSARAQTRLKVLVEITGKGKDPSATTVKHEESVSEHLDQESEKQQQQQNGDDKDVHPSKYLECVVSEDTPQSDSPSKEQDIVPEETRSRASKRKCRLPVRVRRVCLDDEIAHLENVGLDAAEISKIFAEDDFEEETKRKRRGRKRRTHFTRIKSKSKNSKAKSKKAPVVPVTTEDGSITDANGKEVSDLLNISENGSKNTDSDNCEDNGFGDGHGDGDGGEENDGNMSGGEKLKSKVKLRQKKKMIKVDFTSYAWMCADCSEEFSDVETLRHHHTNVHNQIPKYLCNLCSKVFTPYLGFLAHYRRHYEKNQYCTCETCGKCFSNKKALDSHNIIHSDNKPHVCSVCGKAFRQQSALFVHSRCHLPDELKNKFACDECGKRFSTKPNLVTHKRIHTGVRNYTCDQCGKSFVQKGNLDAHLVTHSAVKPFPCDQCDKGFKTELQLKKHSTVHSGIKPHQCDICGRQFRERGTLREHHRIHTGAMPFSCEFCGKAFRFKGVLTTHRRQHTGEKPYTCSECQHAFTNWPNYNKHMKRRHGINTSRQARSAQGDSTQEQPPEVASSTLSLPTSDLTRDSMDIQPPQPNHPEPEIPLGPSSAPLSVCESQIDQPPTTMDPKAAMETHQPQHLYHHENTMSQHSHHSQEDDSMSSHHDMYSGHPVHSPLSAHHPISHAMHAGHSAHTHTGHDEDRESKYVTEREILLGQMSRERDRPHFYNPAPGSSVNTNPYHHHSLHHPLQQTQLPMPGLYSIPQLPLDPSHLEMLHSSASQHR